MDRRVGYPTTASQLFAAGRGVLFGEASHPGPPQRATRPDIVVRVRAKSTPTCTTNTNFQGLTCGLPS
jgi:hypothetical protein